MIKVHLYVDNMMIHNAMMAHCPRVGDTIRFGGPPDRYAKVTEVIWCINEQSQTYEDRVNLRCEEID